MAEESPIEEKAKTNGDDEEYGKFLAEEIAKGNLPVMDGDKIAREGIQLVQQSQARRSAYMFVIDEPDIDKLYKNDPEMALLTRLLKRTFFADRVERFAFLDYVDWCIEFEVPKGNAIRCLMSAVSEGRASINDLLAISTSFNYTARNYNNNVNSKPKKNDRIE